MSKNCSTYQQGYPTVHFHHDCLSHTGSNLVPFTALGIMLLMAGLVLLYYGRKALRGRHGN